VGGILVGKLGPVGGLIPEALGCLSSLKTAPKHPIRSENEQGKKRERRERERERATLPYHPPPLFP